MKVEDSEKVKALIIEANNELEAHNFLRANEICEEAASLDYSNPNIYMIQLLARYEVTEIEDLQNCDVNIYSNYYKKVRLYAGKELNDELDKYIPKNVNAYPEPPKNNLFAGWTNLINNTDGFLVELFLINKPFSKERIETTRNDYFPEETKASVTTFIYGLEFIIITLFFVISFVTIISEFSFMKSLCLLFADFTFIYPIWYVHKKNVLYLKTQDYNFTFYTKYFLRILISIILFILLNALYFTAYGFILYENIYFSAIILASLTIPISITQYKLIFSFISNTCDLYKKIVSTK